MRGMNRRQFATACLAGTAAILAPGAEASALSFRRRRADFTFTRLRYRSGDWDVDQRMPANVLNSLVEYTTVSVMPREQVVDADSAALFESPFGYLAGRRLLEFSSAERDRVSRWLHQGGFLFADDCNHDIDGLFARSFEAEMTRIFGSGALVKLPNDHPIYSAFFKFPDGPPPTALELNGWGDDLVHDYLKGVVVDGRLAVLYSNKDYGCEWDYDFRNKRFYARDNTTFAVNVVLHAMNR